MNVGGGSGERETRNDTIVLLRGGQCVNRTVPCSARAVRGGFGTEVACQCICAGERSQQIITVEHPRPPRHLEVASVYRGGESWIFWLMPSLKAISHLLYLMDLAGP